MKGHHLCILSDLVSIKAVITHMMRRCITSRRKWTGYADNFIVRLGQGRRGLPPQAKVLALKVMEGTDL